MNPFYSFLLALAITLTITPFLRNVSQRTGWLIKKDSAARWSKKNIPLAGGIAFFLSLMIVSLSQPIAQVATWGILAGATIIFLVGLVDDLISLSPPAKLFGQISAALVFVLTGNSTAFFASDIANMIVSIVWLVAISNALNLVDNMDGLSSITTLVTSLFLSYFFFGSSDADLMAISLAIAGGALGFLFFNFPPASIYMGDNGALFLGMTLGGLAISSTPQASNVLGILGVPVLILLLPILDTSMVTITRLFRGQSPAVGGRDHMSHRLVSLGLSERQVVLLLGAISILGGLMAIALEDYSYTVSLIAIPVSILILALFTAFLGQIRLEKEANSGNVISIIKTISNTSGRFHLIETALDFFIFPIAFFLAFVLRFGAPLSDFYNSLIIRSLPLVVLSGFISFFMFRVYQGIWRYMSIREVFRLAQASVIASIFAAFLVVLFYRFEDFSRQVFLYYPLLLFLLVALSRFSFRAFNTLFVATKSSKGVPILIYGAGDAGEFTLRELERNRNLHYKVVGLVDDNPLLKGKEIHSVPVLGTIQDLPIFVQKYGAEGIIISSRQIDPIKIQSLDEIVDISPEFWIKRLRIEFEDVT